MVKLKIFFQYSMNSFAKLNEIHQIILLKNTESTIHVKGKRQ